jgi:hypothetical protein
LRRGIRRETLSSTSPKVINVILTDKGRALVITLLFRLIFGGYIVAMDQYRFNDLTSALTVLLIYVLMGIFASLYLSGKRVGLKGLIGLEAIFLLLNTAFTLMSLGQMIDTGLHSPLNNWWQTLLRCFFSLLTLVLSIRLYREEN